MTKHPVAARFDLHIGIDYSGGQTPKSRTPALQVYAAFDTEEPRRILSPASTVKTYKNWNRKEIAEWLIEQARKNITFIAGIDHGFSFPTGSLIITSSVRLTGRYPIHQPQRRGRIENLLDHRPI